MGYGDLLFNPLGEAENHSKLWFSLRLRASSVNQLLFPGLFPSSLGKVFRTGAVTCAGRGYAPVPGGAAEQRA